jgi:hypothetical protein
MSDDSNVTAPEPGPPAGTDPPAADEQAPDTAAPDGHAPDEQAPREHAPGASALESRLTGRLSRMMPSWTRRRPLLTGFGAGILAAAVMAGAVFVAVQPSGPPRGAYTSLPKQPCTMISAAELGKYLPGATGIPVTIGTSGPVRAGTCKWSSTTGDEARTLIAQVLLYSSPSSVSLARQAYRSLAASLDCRCKGVTVTLRPAPGIGDQATEGFISAGPEADFVSSPNASLPGANLLVRSSNAVVSLNLDTMATASGLPMASPPDAAQVAAMISMARGVLAQLAQAGSPPPSASAPMSPEPNYAGRRDPCRLITAATLARYAPGATLGLGPVPSSSANRRRSDGCNWSSGNTFVLLTLNTFPDAASAWQGYQSDAVGIGQGVNGVTGTQWLHDLGEEAAAIFKTQSGKDGVELLVWSGNVELNYWYTTTDGPSRPRPTLLAGAIAMSRDGLAALTSPAASSFPPEPRYASPHDPCTLITASTLARYASGATLDKLPTSGGGSGTAQSSGCIWTSDSVSILLSVIISADPDSAKGNYQFGIQGAKQNQAGTKFLGARPVRGVGEQATEIFQTMTGTNSPAVTLYVLSGNASLQVTSSDVGIGTPPSRAGKLAADIAMARDVLAGLRHT